MGLLSRDDLIVAQAHGILMARYDSNLSTAARTLTVTAGIAGLTDEAMAQQLVAEVQARARTARRQEPG